MTSYSNQSGVNRPTPVKWITRERPKIDRVVCPWLITWFIDEAPEFIFVPPSEVIPQAAAFMQTNEGFDEEGVADMLESANSEQDGGRRVAKRHSHKPSPPA